MHSDGLPVGVTCTVARSERRPRLARNTSRDTAAGAAELVLRWAGQRVVRDVSRRHGQERRPVLATCRPAPSWWCYGATLLGLFSRYAVSQVFSTEFSEG